MRPFVLTWQAGPRHCGEATLRAVETRTATTTLRLVRESCPLTVSRLQETVFKFCYHIFILLKKYLEECDILYCNKELASPFRLRMHVLKREFL